MKLLKRAIPTLAIGALVVVAACGLWPGGTDVSPEVTIAVSTGELRESVPAKGVLEAVHASPIAVPRVPTGALKVKAGVKAGVQDGETFGNFNFKIALEDVYGETP